MEVEETFSYVKTDSGQNTDNRQIQVQQALIHLNESDP